MKKVTAYESSNGRLYHTEEECLKYEKKLAQFPKVAVTEEELKDWNQSFCTQMPNGVIKRTTKRQETPSGQITRKVEYIVGGYTMTINGGMAAHYLEHVGASYSNKKKQYEDHREVGRMVARAILEGKEITDELLEGIVHEFNAADKYAKMYVETKKVGKQWYIDDNRWKTGVVPPLFFNIEKND